MKQKLMVVKAGSSLLVDERHKLNIDFMARLVGEICFLEHTTDYRFLIVTSGAVASGKSSPAMHFRRPIVGASLLGVTDEVVRSMCQATIGQPRLMTVYQELFQEHDRECSQHLLTLDDFIYPHVEAIIVVLENLIRAGITPVVNTNDGNTVEALKRLLPDNDYLAARLAVSLSKSFDVALTMLTDVDGVYDGDPSDPKSILIHRIESPLAFREYVNPNAGTGKGNMTSKLEAADLMQRSGGATYIVNGGRTNILTDIIVGIFVGTEILPRPI